MKLEDAIKHCLEVAETNTCKECADEHMQLYEWLLELKSYREKK